MMEVFPWFNKFKHYVSSLQFVWFGPPVVWQSVNLVTSQKKKYSIIWDASWHMIDYRDLQKNWCKHFFNNVDGKIEPD